MKPDFTHINFVGRLEILQNFKHNLSQNWVKSVNSPQIFSLTRDFAWVCFVSFNPLDPWKINDHKNWLRCWISVKFWPDCLKVVLIWRPCVFEWFIRAKILNFTFLSQVKIAYANFLRKNDPFLALRSLPLRYFHK